MLHFKYKNVLRSSLILALVGITGFVGGETRKTPEELLNETSFQGKPGYAATQLRIQAPNISSTAQSTGSSKTAVQKPLAIEIDNEGESTLPNVTKKYNVTDLGQLEGESIDSFTLHPKHRLADISWPGTGLNLGVSRVWDLPPEAFAAEGIASPKAFLNNPRWYNDRQQVGGLLGDWQLEIPYIAIGVGYTVGDYGGNALLAGNPGAIGETYVGVCNQPRPQSSVCQRNDEAGCLNNIDNKNWWKPKNHIWRGVKIHGLGGEVKELMRPTGLIPGTEPYVTLDDWVASCTHASIDTPAEDPIPMNGFEVKSTDGITYYFTEVRQAKFLINTTLWNGGFETSPDFRVYLSRVKDVFGNELTYSYRSPNPADENYFAYIEKITASDGRELLFTYQANPAQQDAYTPVRPDYRIESITAVDANDDETDRVWQYGYDADTGRLNKVTDPVGKEWGYERNISWVNNATKDEAIFTYPEGGKLTYNLGHVSLLSSYSGQHPDYGNKPNTTINLNYSTPILAVGQRETKVNPGSPDVDSWHYYIRRTEHDPDPDDPSPVPRKLYYYETYVVGPDYVEKNITNGDLLTFFGVTYQSYRYPRPDGLVPPASSVSSTVLANFIDVELDQDGEAAPRQLSYLNWSLQPYLVGDVCMIGEGFKVSFSNGIFWDCPFEIARASRVRLFLKSNDTITDYSNQALTTHFTENHLYDPVYNRPGLVIESEHSGRSPKDNTGLTYFIRCHDITYWDNPDLRIIGQEKSRITTIGEIDYNLLGQGSGVNYWTGCNDGQKPAVITNTREYDSSSVSRTFKPATGRVNTESINNRAAKSFVYKATGEVSSVIDESQLKTQYLNYQRGIPQTIRQVGASKNIDTAQEAQPSGYLKSQTSPRGDKTSFSYSSDTELSSVDLPIQADVAVDWDYSSYPVAKTITKGNGGSHYFSRAEKYDGFGRLLSSQETDVPAGKSVYINREYDTGGRIVFKSYPSSLPNESQGVRTEYDILGRQTKAYRTVNPSVTMATEYFDRNFSHQTDERGNVTDFYFRTFGARPGEKELMKVETAVNLNDPVCGQTAVIVTEFKRDVEGNIREVKRGCKGEPSSDLSQTYEYDTRLLPMSQKIPEILPKKLFNYNDFGQIASASFEGIGNSNVDYEYDDFNRLKSITYAEAISPDIIFTYDDNGNVDTKDNGVLLDYDYNALNQLTQQKLVVDGIVDLRMNYEYSATGAVTKITYPTGYQIDLNPDNFGRPTKVGEFVTNITYHPNGELSEMEYANGQMTTILLDERKLIWDVISHKTAGVTAMAQIYSYDEALNIKEIEDGKNPESNRLLEYDTLNRLVGVEYTDKNPVVQTNIDYDSKGNLISKSNLFGTVDYEYWPDLNRLKSTSNGLSGDYKYNNFGAIKEDSRNLYEYNQAGQLLSVRAKGVIGGETSYLYDADGWRVKTKKGDKEIYTMHVNNQLMFEYNATDNWIKEYYYLGDKLVTSRRVDDPVNADSDSDGISDLVEITL